MLSDLRYAWRVLRRRPGFTAVAVVTLALGIGANVAVFSLVRAVLLGPLPMPDAQRLVTVTERRGTSRNADLPLSGHEFVAWQEQNRVFERAAMYRAEPRTLTGVGEPQTLSAVLVSHDYFPLLGLTAARGRVFTADEDATPAPRVAVLSDMFWRTRFDADPDVVGRTVTLDDQPFTVVGVMPPLPPSLSPHIWLPIDVAAEALAVGRHNLYAIARLAPGITLEHAQRDLGLIADRLARDLPESNTDHQVKIAPFRETLVGEFRRPLLLLLCAVAFVLLIACVNVANLLLAENAGRQREIAVRTALGGGRWRVVRQLMIESLLLSALGGIAGLLIAAWLVDVATSLSALQIPLLETARLDRTTLAVAAAIATFTGIVAGLVPALRWTRPAQGSVHALTRTGDDRGHRLRSTLVAAEVALTLMLLVGTGLMTNSFLRLTSVDPGFTTHDVTVVPVDLPASRYGQAHERRAFVNELIARLRAIPGVSSAAAVSHLPLGGSDNWMPFAIEGQPEPPPGQEPNAPFRVATGDYFETMDIPLRRGRFFADADARRAVPLIRWYPAQSYPPEFDRPQPMPVALISEAAARQFWPNDDPIGKRIRVLYSPEITIVGIVGDVKHNALDLPAYPHIYLSHNQEPWNSLSVVVRTHGAVPITTAVREQLHALDAALPVTIRTMDDVRSASIGRPRLFVMFIGMFGTVALGLALVGIFGVVSYLAAQRTREIGVRLALGAQRRQILMLIAGQGLRPIAAGLLVGLVGAVGLTRFIATLLYDVEPTDPLTFATVALLLFAIALLACLLPAYRASRRDPVAALRVD